MDFGESFLDEITSGKSFKPSDSEMIQYLFWEKGIAYDRFKDLPIPYILKIIKTHGWVKKEEEKAHKKANKK